MEHENTAGDGVIREQREGNVQTQLQLVLAELRNQRQEVHALKEEIQGNSFNVASEVKKLRTDKDIVWKYQGNKIQFDFNTEVDEINKQIAWAIEHSKLDYCKELLNELSEKLRKRNKLIRIADSSVGGWDTVKLYVANPIASDSNDESKIYKAENRALKRKRSNARGGKGRPAFDRRSNSSGFFPPSKTGCAPVLSTRPGIQQPFPRGRLFRGAYGFGTTSTSNNLAYTPATGPCYACGEFGHFRRECSYINRGTAGNQSGTGK